MNTHLDIAIAAIADRQQGNITHTQLAGLGLSRNQIVYRVSVGRLYPVHRGVYAVGRPARTALERACAAVLACGPGAALSHLSALALWDLASWPWAVSVTVPGDRRHRDIKVHSSKQLLRRDFRRQASIRVTSPARTLLDSASFLRERALARAVNEALSRKLVRRSDLTDVVQRFPRHPGARLLGRFADTEGGPTRSQWEDAFPAFCERFGLPEPIMAAKVAGYTVDGLFAEEKVIVELDSWAFHQSRESFEGDRERDAATLAAGHVTIRLTWRRMMEAAAAEAARLDLILGARRSQAA